MKRILVIAPHPDDESIGCGGTICDHTQRGEAVRVVLLTSGENGGHGRDRQETAKIREREAVAATRILDCEKTEFWREPDGALRCTAALIDRMRRYLLRWKPANVYVTHSGEMHPDHRAAERLMRNAVVAARQVAKRSRPELWGYEVWTPIRKLDKLVDITEHLPTKLSAIKAHRTQCAHVNFVEASRGLGRYRGELHSWPGGPFAEAFTKINA